MTKNRIVSIMLRINQKVIITLICVAITLIMLDLIITIIGIVYELEEGNIITLTLLYMFGDFYGLVTSALGKSLVITFPFIIYQSICKKLDKKLDKNFKNISYTNIYWTLYTLLLIVTMMTTLYINTNNTILIIFRLKELYIT